MFNVAGNESRRLKFRREGGGLIRRGEDRVSRLSRACMFKVKKKKKENERFRKGARSSSGNENFRPAKNLSEILGN